MPIENSWEKIDIITKLDIAPAEWQLAKAAMQQEIARLSANSKQDETKIFNFKIERENVGKRGGGIKGLNHSFIVVNGKLIALARAKIYFVAEVEKHEGILGYGAFAVCKVGQMENGDQVAVKIEPTYIDEITKNAEITILQELGALQGVFVRKRSESLWINNDSITDKHYTVETLWYGKNMEALLHPTTLKINGYAANEELLLAFKTAVAIKQLHERNIVHNDIKPENFIVNKETRSVAVIDYGLAIKLANAQDHAPALGCSDEYAAPEMVDVTHIFNGDCSKSSDVYALGKMYQQHFILDTIIDNSTAGIILKEQIRKMLCMRSADRVTMDEVVCAFEKYYAELKEQQDIKDMMATRGLYFYSTAKGSIGLGNKPPSSKDFKTYTRPYPLR